MGDTDTDMAIPATTDTVTVTDMDTVTTSDTVTATTSDTDMPTITARDPLSPLPPPNPVMVMPTMVITVTLMPTDTVTLMLTDTVMVMASKFILSPAVCRYLFDTAVLYASLIRRILICDPQYLKSNLQLSLKRF